MHALKAPKAPKLQKAQKHNQSKAQNTTRNAFKKHLRGKKLLIRLFAFLCFFCARRKENRKKKIEKREKSPQGNVLKEHWKKEKSPTMEMY